MKQGDIWLVCEGFTYWHENLTHLFEGTSADFRKKDQGSEGSQRGHVKIHVGLTSLKKLFFAKDGDHYKQTNKQTKTFHNQLKRREKAIVGRPVSTAIFTTNSTPEAQGSLWKRERKACKSQRNIVCHDIRSPRKVTNATHDEVSPTRLPEGDMNKDTNGHSNTEGGGSSTLHRPGGAASGRNNLPAVGYPIQYQTPWDHINNVIRLEQVVFVY